jgi:L-threonylcarbamoyladenylate synthase
MLTNIIPANLEESIPLALAALREGKPIAFPTDTVYGLGADLLDPDAIEQLFIVKKRPLEKAIPVLIGDPGDITKVSDKISYLAMRLAEAFWPGALTLVLPRHPSLPKIISPTDTVGVRMPNHPFAISLLNRSGPLATTSANLTSGPSTMTALEVKKQLNGRIPLILDGGRTPGGVPSTVVDCTGKEPKILRPGPILFSDILKVLHG